MNPKKPRGRPKGTVISTDGKTLSAVADLLLREPALLPTSAIKRVVPDWTDSVVHRLRGKWRKQSDALLADARQRSSEREARRKSSASVPAGLGLGGIASYAAKMRAFQDSPAVLAAQKMLDSPAMRLMWEIENNPTVRLMREMHNSPAMRTIQAMQDSPLIRSIQQMQESPLMKLIAKQERQLRDFGF